VFTVIFIPLTFLVGVYGMNFKFMPELNWYWGYPLSLMIMFVIAVSMLLYMKNKKWL
jgi:magnesium transporter